METGLETLMSLETGNNLKLKVKYTFPLSIGLMLINYSNPYIHSTTILCDIVRKSGPVEPHATHKRNRLIEIKGQLV